MTEVAERVIVMLSKLVPDECKSMVPNYGSTDPNGAPVMTLRSIRSWRNGEISGKRCAKNIIDTFTSMAAGIGGAIGGAIIGKMILPEPTGGIGSLIGATIGGALSGNVGAKLIDWLTRTIFNVPKDVELENSFNFYCLSPAASNEQITSRYRELALVHHPDRGGTRENWDKLLWSTATIKASRDPSAAPIRSRSCIKPWVKPVMEEIV